MENAKRALLRRRRREDHDNADDEGWGLQSARAKANGCFKIAEAEQFYVERGRY